MDLSEFVKALALSIVDGVRRNRLPAGLSLIALILTGALAFTSNFDERPHYRKYILPKIQKAELQFFDIMSLAEKESTEPRRTLYFIEGHRRAKNALRIVRSERPMTETGRNAQFELARYYELVDEDFSIIRTAMSNDESYDYIAEWKHSNAELLPIRKHWLDWLETGNK
jgi:hypothetical protein